jgi:aspartyl aminopeptidase
MAHLVLHDNQGKIIALVPKITSPSGGTITPIAGSDQTVSEIDIPDDIAKMHPTQLLEEFSIDVHSGKPKLISKQ